MYSFCSSFTRWRQTLTLKILPVILYFFNESNFWIKLPHLAHSSTCTARLFINIRQCKIVVQGLSLGRVSIPFQRNMLFAEIRYRNNSLEWNQGNTVCFCLFINSTSMSLKNRAFYCMYNTLLDRNTRSFLLYSNSYDMTDKHSWLVKWEQIFHLYFDYFGNNGLIIRDLCTGTLSTEALYPPQYLASCQVGHILTDFTDGRFNLITQHCDNLEVNQQLRITEFAW